MMFPILLSRSGSVFFRIYHGFFPFQSLRHLHNSKPHRFAPFKREVMRLGKLCTQLDEVMVIEDPNPKGFYCLGLEDGRICFVEHCLW